MEFDPYIDKLYSCSQWCQDISPELAVQNHINIINDKSQESLKNLPSETVFYIINNPTVENRFHFFPSNTDCSKLVIYIHGGFWQLLDLDCSVFLAKFFIEKNYNFASIGYDLCPSVTLRDIVCEIRKGLKVLMDRYKNINTIYLFGHSAGAHLALMCAIYDGYSPELLLSIEEKKKLNGLILLSGIYDVRPVCQISDNIILNLSVEQAWQLSPIRCIKNLDTFGIDFPVLIMVAEYDSPAFIDQSVQLKDISSKFSKPIYYLVKSKDHFNLCHDIGNIDDFVSNTILEFLQSADKTIRKTC